MSHMSAICHYECEILIGISIVDCVVRTEVRVNRLTQSVQGQSVERGDAAHQMALSFPGSKLASPRDGPASTARGPQGLEEDGTESTNQARVHWSTRRAGGDAQKRGERGRSRDALGEKEQSGTKAFGGKNTTSADFVVHL